MPRFQLLLLLLFCAILPGCSIKQPYAVKQSYVLYSPRKAAPLETRKDKVLRIRTIQALPRFEGKGFVYRKGDLLYEVDFYNEFFSSPKSLVGEQVREWIAGSQIFEHVVEGTGQLTSNYALETLVKGFHGDFQSHPRSVMAIQFTLLDYTKGKGSVVLSKVYEAEVSLKKRSGPELIEGWNNCLRQILEMFEKDLQTKI